MRNMWNIESTIQTMRAMSLSASADQLTQVFAQHVRNTASVNRAIVINRADLTDSRYRVERFVYWDDNGNSVESQPNEIREGGLLAQLLYAGELRLIDELDIFPGEPAYDLLQGEKALMAFPIFDKGVATRGIILLSTELSVSSPSELCGLAMMSGLLDRALEAHSLVRQVEVTCEALDGELAAAAAVQRWLLPHAIPAPEGVSIASSYCTAKQSGGDYYNVVDLPDGKLGLLVADVCGKGAPAAVLMAVVRTIVQLRGERWESPAFLLNEIHNHLCALRVADRGTFVTAFCAILDVKTGALSYCSAGHHPPRFFRRSGNEVIGLEGAKFLPMGLGLKAIDADEHVRMSNQDTILLYTDGIVEARSTDGELFGAERLDQVLLNLPQPSNAHAAVDAIAKAVRNFSSEEPLSDDQTLLAVSIDGGCS